MTTPTRPATNPTPVQPALHKLDVAAFALVMIFLFIGLLTLGNYGISWDEGLGNFFFGNRYAQYITTFDPIYLDFEKTLAEDQPGALRLEQSAPFRDRANEFPGLIDTLSGSFMRVFGYELRMADPVDAFHSFTIVLTSLYLLLQYLYITRLFNRPIAFMSILLLATYPRFWGDMHFNPKDVPEAALFGLAVMSFAIWARKPNMSDAVLTGIFAGLALGVKANALFLPVVFGAWLLLWLASGRQGMQDLLSVAIHWWHGSVMVFMATLAYWASWPLLYTRPGYARLYFEYIFSQGGRQAKGEWSLQPLKMVYAASPEIFLLVLALGVIVAGGLLAKRLPWGRNAALLLVWLAVPIVRISMPMAINFDGVRHFLEFLPAATILGGLGVFTTIEWLRTRHDVANTAMVAFLATYFLVNISQAHTQYFPYEYIYFNQISGGTAGAQATFKQGEVSDYWAVSYRDGVAWLNKHAEPNAHLYVAIGDYLVNITAGNWLRPDITLVSASQLSELHKDGKTIYMMHITRPSFYKTVAKACDGTRPIYQKWVGGVSVMQIIDLAHCPAGTFQ